MSKIKIQGNASGTGVVTLTAPNTNTDRTITLPDGTGSILMTDGDGSALTSLTGSQVDSGQVTAKAWVNFNGTGTVAIRDSYNVSSVTDRGVGKYTLNFTNAMANINYSLSGLCFLTSDGTYAHQPQIGYREPTAPLTTTTARFNICWTQVTTYLDTEYITLQVFGD